MPPHVTFNTHLPVSAPPITMPSFCLNEKAGSMGILFRMCTQDLWAQPSSPSLVLDEEKVLTGGHKDIGRRDSQWYPGT